MDLAYFAYLLFVIPGFCFVWTFRHFTSQNSIGDFEYAAWSFLWGFVLFFLATSFDAGEGMIFDLNDPFKLFSTSLGAGLGIAMGFAFPFGCIGAWLCHQGLFTWINKKLNKLVRIKL